MISLLNGFETDKALSYTSQTIFTLWQRIPHPTFFSSARVLLTAGTKHLFNAIQGKTHKFFCVQFTKKCNEVLNI